jgi:hypothetical protein
MLIILIVGSGWLKPLAQDVSAQQYCAAAAIVQQLVCLTIPDPLRPRKNKCASSNPQVDPYDTFYKEVSCSDSVTCITDFGVYSSNDTCIYIEEYNFCLCTYLSAECWVGGGGPSLPGCFTDCSELCGQGDGCGGNCSDDDAGSPTAPVISPIDGSTVSVTLAQPTVRLSWSEPDKSDSYELQVYPAGTNCSNPDAYCASVTNDFYRLTASYPNYTMRVRALNSTCDTEYSSWSAANFSVQGTVRGQVKQDDSNLAVLVGGICQLTGAISDAHPGIKEPGKPTGAGL